MERTIEYLNKLLSAKEKLSKAINKQLADLLSPTVLEAIAMLTGTPQEMFTNIDIDAGNDVLVIYTETEIHGNPYSVRIGIPTDIAFQSAEEIYIFMKQQIENQNEESYNIPITYNDGFDLTLLSDSQQKSLKLIPKSQTRH